MKTTDIFDNLQILIKFGENELDDGRKIKDLSLQELHNIVLVMEVKHDFENPTYRGVTEDVTPVFDPELQTEEYKKKQKKLKKLYTLFKAYAYLKSLANDLDSL